MKELCKYYVPYQLVQLFILSKGSNTNRTIALLSLATNMFPTEVTANSSQHRTYLLFINTFMMDSTSPVNLASFHIFVNILHSRIKSRTRFSCRLYGGHPVLLFVGKAPTNLKNETNIHLLEVRACLISPLVRRKWLSDDPSVAGFVCEEAGRYGGIQMYLANSYNKCVCPMIGFSLSRS